MKHKVKKEIDELKEMLKELKPVDDIRDQAKKIRNSCVGIRNKLQEYAVSLSALPLLIKNTELIIKEGYNRDDLQITLELCDQMEELYVSVEKRLVELEKKIAEMSVKQKEQVKMAQKGLEELKDQERIVEKVEKVF